MSSKDSETPVDQVTPIETPVETPIENTSTPDETPTKEEPIAPELLYTEANPMKLPKELPEEFILGIDLGNEKSVISIAKIGELHRLPFPLHNTIGDLTHPTLVSIGKERFFGGQAQSQIIVNPTNTVYDLKSLVGENPSTQTRPYLFKTIQVNNEEEESPQYGVDFAQSEFLEGNAQTKLTFEHLTGSFLHNLASCAETDRTYWEHRHKHLLRRVPPFIPVEKIQPEGIRISQAALAIPANFSPKQRAAILDAAAIAGLQVEHLVDEGVAAALAYSVTRKHELEELELSGSNSSGAFPKTILVVDLGQRYLHACLAQIGFHRAKILASAALQVGVADLIRKSSAQFEEILKAKLGGEFSARSKARLMLAIGKALKILSTVPTTFVEVDSFTPDVDVKEPFSREQLESWSDDEIQQIRAFLSDLLDSHQIDRSTLEVEIIGGGCRIPVIQRTILSTVGVSQLHSHLDGNNSVAIGAAIYGSIQSFKPEENLDGESKEAIDPRKTFQLDWEQNPASSASELQSLRFSEKTLQESIAFEKELLQKDHLIHALKEIRNELEHFLYKFSDDLAAHSGKLPSEESERVRKILDEEQMFLYSDEAEGASLEDFQKKLQSLKDSLKESAPTLHRILDELRVERERLEAEAAAAELTRETVVRDKIADPKTPKEKLEAAKKRKEQGNQFIQDVNYEHAATRYLQAINLLMEVPGVNLQEEVEQTKLACYLNLAVAYLNLKKYNLAVENANLALGIDADNVKGYFRRGKGLYAQKKYVEAKADFQAAVDRDPSNSLAKKQIALCDKQVQLEKEREKKMYSKMFA